MTLKQFYQFNLLLQECFDDISFEVQSTDASGSKYKVPVKHVAFCRDFINSNISSDDKELNIKCKFKIHVL